MSDKYRLILTSRGLNQRMGVEIVQKVYTQYGMKHNSIFLVSLPHYYSNLNDILRKSCEDLGFKKIYFSSDYEGKAIEKMPKADVVYVTEGNTFLVADYCSKHHFDEYIRREVFNGAVYIGSSAGAIYAGCSYKEAEYFDSNYFDIKSYEGLGILPGNGQKSDTVIPHYTYAQLQRYKEEFMSENDIAGYENIYNICNDEALIMDCVREAGGMIILEDKRRIRLDEAV